MIKDLSMAEAPPELLAIFSSAVLPALLEAEADDGDGVRDFAYDAPVTCSSALAAPKLPAIARYT
jgi:hypothetical protein